jgi:hypothetical protein
MKSKPAGLPAAEAVIVQLEIPLPTVAAAMSAAADAIVLLNPAPAPATTLPAALLGVAGVLVPNLAELARLANDGRPADLPPASDLTEVEAGAQPGRHCRCRSHPGQPRRAGRLPVGRNVGAHRRTTGRGRRHHRGGQLLLRHPGCVRRRGQRNSRVVTTAR